MQKTIPGTPSTHSHALNRQLFKVTVNKHKLLNASCTKIASCLVFCNTQQQNVYATAGEKPQFNVHCVWTA